MLLQTAIQIERRKDDFAQLLFYGWEAAQSWSQGCLRSGHHGFT